jgi:hypothetical protein
MRKFVVLTIPAMLLLGGVSFAQESEAPDPYKPILDRLESLEMVQLPEWRYHGDMPHPEDPSVSDTDWPVVKLREEWKTGARVLRRTIEIPEKINGYAVRGARVKLDLRFSSNDSITITVFSNGSLVERGDEDTQQPISLTENAQPGQTFVIAVRVDCGEGGTHFYRSQLNLEAAANRPDPGILREEIRRFPSASANKIESTRSLAEAVHHSRGGQLAHRHGVAVALDRNRRSSSKHVSKRIGPSAGISGLQIHDVLGACVCLDGRKISRSLQRNRAASARGPLGGYRRDVGRAGFEHAGRRIPGTANPCGQALLPK